jgi:hypothetical protein
VTYYILVRVIIAIPSLILLFDQDYLSPEQRAIGIVLIIREDYLASLDPFRDSLPEKLRPRFRLELMSKTSALEAVKGPLESMNNPNLNIESKGTKIREFLFGTWLCRNHYN